MRPTAVTSPEYAGLYALGWPYLRVLTDDPIDKKGAIKEARKALEAIDPTLPTHLPRDLARRYLRGYIVADPYSGKSDVKKAISDDTAPIDADWLAQILSQKLGPSPSLGYGRETYTFRLAEIVFLFEAFLGTRTVARALVEHLVAARDNPAWWGDAFFRDHENACAMRLIPVLGWLRLRLDSSEWSALVAPLAGEQPALPRFMAGLAALVDDTADLENVHHPEWIAMQRRDVAWLHTYLADCSAAWGYWNDPQMYYVVGTEALERQPVNKLSRLPKWMQLRVVEEFGTLRDDHVEPVMQALVASRSAGKAATDWLAARGLEAPAPAAKRTRKQLDSELAALIAGVGQRLRAHQGDEAAERQVLAQTFAAYCEIRAALEDPIPEAYFTHHLADVCGDWEVDEATVERWMALAVETSVG